MVALPSKAFSSHHKLGENNRFVRKEHSCDPLAVKYVIEDTNQRLEVVRCSMVKLNPEKTAVSEASLADALVSRRIAFHEAKIGSVEEVLECCCLPVLAD